MKLKLYYRSPVIWNMILYILLSLTFLYFQFLYMNTESVLNKETLKLFISESPLLMVLFALTAMSFLKNNGPISKILFIASIAITSLFTIQNLTLDFSKFLILILFFYILIAFYLYQFFSIDSDEAFLNPGYHENLLFEPILRRIPIQISTKDNESIDGYLTNWGERGCFVLLNEALKKPKSIKMKVSAFEHEFVEMGSIVSKASDGRGYGIKFQEIKKVEKIDSLGWSEFYEIIEEMGFESELLR